jgi:predicted permease
MVSVWDTLRQRIAALPGVVAATVSVEGLLAGGSSSGPLIVVDGRDSEREATRVQATMTVAPGFFGTAGYRMIEGRDFTSQDDAASPAVVIVNQSFARRVVGGTSAIGQRLRIANSSLEPMEIVGVVSDAINVSPQASGHELTLYYPPGQNPRRLTRAMCLIVRTAGPPGSAALAVRKELTMLVPRMPILRMTTVDEQLDSVLFQERLLARVASWFALVALLLSCTGLYGVMAFTTARRASEIGIRLALGASRGSVMREVFRRSGAIVLAGLLVSVPVTIAAGRFLAPRLFGVSVTDPATVVSGCGLVVALAMAAVFMPAFRASRIDPLTAIRTE